MRALFLRLHIAIQAYFVKWFRVRHTLKVFAKAHQLELKETPLFNWPVVLAKQAREMEAIRAGRLDQITERKSWSWPFLPASVNRLSVPIIKSTPYNLRRMSRTPVPRRAINLVKGAMISLPWDVRPIDGTDPVDDEDQEEQAARIKIAKRIFTHPNGQDSFQTFLEQGIEDKCILGAFVAEQRITPDPERPLKLWPVNVESIRIFPAWAESTPNMPHYAQMTGLKGERGAVLFYDDELLYIKDNPSTDNPFGLGKMEVAFSAVNDLLGVQGMAGRAGSDQVHKCFPEGTEVLTRRGWLLWRDVREDDEYATRSIDGRFQWQRAIGFVKEHHDGDLIQFSNRELRITVTPNHRMYGWRFRKDWRSGKREAEALGFVEAVDLFDEVINRPGKGWRGLDTHDPVLADFRIPARSVWQDGALPSSKICVGDRTFSWKDWTAFLGIWVAEGSCLGASVITPDGVRKPPKGDYRVQIAQSKHANRSKYKQIDNLLNRMGLCYQRKADRFIFADRDIWTYLSFLGCSHTKFVPQWVKDAPARIIRVFVDWAMLGDGSVGPRGKRVYYTVSQQLAGDMQELFQKIGSSAAIRSYQDGDSLMYAVEEMLREDISIVPDAGRGKARMPKRIPYTGYVYCAMVPNGTLYCRENGYAFWSGNTWLWWEHPQNDSAYQIVRRHIQNEMEGQAKVSIIGGMKKPEIVEITPVKEEDLLLHWQEMLIRMVGNAFDLSALALGIEHDVNRATGEVLDDKDFRSCVVPMAKRLQEGITRKCLHTALGWYDLELVFLNLDDPDAQTKMDMYAREYSANAITPNEIRKGMGRKPWTTEEHPFGDLTQFECMLLNIQAMEDTQNNLADAGAKRQLQVQQIQQKLNPPQPPPPDGTTPATQPDKSKKQFPPQQQQPGGGGQQPQGGMEKITPGTVSRGGQPPSMKPLSLPKFPIASSSNGKKYTAKQLARLPLNQMQDVWSFSGMTAAQLLMAMDQQENGILETLTQEVKQFFDQILEQEANKPKAKIPPALLKKWAKALGIKLREQNKRTNDFGTWLYKLGQQAGKPGGGSSPRSKSGVPGDLNKITRV